MSRDLFSSVPNSDVVLALGAVALWSTVATAFKLGLELFTPLQLLTLASAVATLLFSVLTLTRPTAVDTDRTRTELLRAAGLGLLNPLAYYLVLFAAYDQLPAQIAQPLNYTWSITLALMAVPLLGQPLSRRRLQGIGISYLGVLIILAPWSVDARAAITISGVALALFSTLLWASYWLLNARSNADPVWQMTIGFAVATAVLFVLCSTIDGWPVLTPRGFGIVLWVGLAEMGVAFLLWQAALRRSQRAALLGQLIFLAPFVSLLFIHNVLGEAVRATSVIGLLVIVGGLAWGGWAAVKASSTRRPAPAQSAPASLPE